MLDPAPAKLAAPCKDPVSAPLRSLKRAEVEDLWAQDKASLVDCRDRKAGEQGYYRKRDEAIAQ